MAAPPRLPPNTTTPPPLRPSAAVSVKLQAVAAPRPGTRVVTLALDMRDDLGPDAPSPGDFSLDDNRVTAAAAAIDECLAEVTRSLAPQEPIPVPSGDVTLHQGHDAASAGEALVARATPVTHCWPPAAVHGQPPCAPSRCCCWRCLMLWQVLQRSLPHPSPTCSAVLPTVRCRRLRVLAICNRGCLQLEAQEGWHPLCHGAGHPHERWCHDGR
jgi:hypothetical protein